MRLEFEPNVISSHPAEGGTATDTSIPDSINFEYLLAQGIKAAQKGDRAQARTLLTEAAELDPKSEDAWMWLASISDYPEELLAFLGRALEINPENQKAISWQAATRSLLAKTLVQRAVAAHQEGSTDLAAKCLDEALELDSDCEMAWFWKASLSNDEEQRLEFLDCVITINPNNEEARSAMESIRSSRSERELVDAKRAIACGDTSAAIEMLDRALEQTPHLVEALQLRAHFSISLEEKLEHLRRALDVAPDDPATTAAFDLLTTVARSQTSVDQGSQQSHAAEDSSHDSVVEPFPPEPATNYEADDNSVVMADVPSGYQDDAAAIMNEANDNMVDDETMPTSVEEFSTEDTLDDEFIMPTAFPPITADAYELPADPFIHQDDLSPASSAPEDVGFDRDQKSEMEPCPFCNANIDPQQFQCSSCRAMLTLADLESLLANSNVDSEAIQEAVTQMESEYRSRPFCENDLTILGIGHLNLRNYRAGREYLQEASRLNPNNVILASHVNAIAIRMEEMDRAADAASTMPKGRTILVVDDSATVRKLISAKLEKSGHKVICAEDGVEALARIDERMPDLVLLDITMPRMDGYEVCKNIRSNPAAQSIPVVMISGKDGFFDKVRGKMAGTTGYITKPFGPETLMRALETYLVPDTQPILS